MSFIGSEYFVSRKIKTLHFLKWNNIFLNYSKWEINISFTADSSQAMRIYNEFVLAKYISLPILKLQIHGCLLKDVLLHFEWIYHFYNNNQVYAQKKINDIDNLLQAVTAVWLNRLICNSITSEKKMMFHLYNNIK